jgi:LmbE family N-acetylglucosaminyl deacetylase
MRVRWKDIFRFYEFIQPLLKVSRHLEEKPPGSNVLVLSPHIDDDILGAGGTLHKHHLAGDRIVSVYLTDTELRKREGEEAAKVIGIDEVVFLDYPIRELDKHPEIAEKIAQLVEQHKPEILYLPFMIDNHNDHISTNKIFLNALELIPHSPLLYAYEVWSTFLPNVLVDITEQIERKKRAILSYKSQLAGNDYLNAIISLNRYRGILSKAKQYAEGFFRATPEAYRTLWEAVYGA